LPSQIVVREPNMKREEVLRILSQHRGQLEQRHGLRFIALFGSVARDQASPESDIDLLVEFATRPGFDGYMRLKEHLESLLDRRVDLVMTGALKPSIRPEIEREAIRVA
jgi:predicted nucleotidyltransferase